MSSDFADNCLRIIFMCSPGFANISSNYYYSRSFEMTEDLANMATEVSVSDKFFSSLLLFLYGYDVISKPCAYINMQWLRI